MDRKYLIVVSIFALMAVFVIHTEDVIILQESTPIISSIIVIPIFSWTDSFSFVGRQNDGFLSKATLNYSKNANAGRWLIYLMCYKIAL